MEGSETRVLVADPDNEARAVLAGELADAGFEVVAVASGAEALAVAEERQPNVAILEIPLGEICGYEVCRVLRDLSHGGTSVVFLSGSRTEFYDRVAGLMLGADDYVVKPYARDELLARVRRLVREVEPERTARLTPREREVLSLLAAGASIASIASDLFISQQTVRTHIDRIHSKLGVHSRVQAVAVAYRERLVEPLGG